MHVLTAGFAVIKVMETLFHPAMFHKSHIWNIFLQDMINKYKMKNKTMEEGVLCNYTIALLRILETLHACDIIHGDIKPDNFLVLDR